MMSPITTGSDYAFGSQLIANSAGLKQQVDTLTQQSSSGYVSSTFAGLGSGAGSALALQPQIAQIATVQANISAATTRIQASQTVMTQLTTIATQFENSATLLGTTGTTDVNAVASQARDALGQVAALLNTKSGGVYLFSGQDTGNPAVPDAGTIATSSFFTSIQTAVQGLTANGVTATEASTLAAATANTPFSSTLGTAPPMVDAGNGQQLAIGIVAGVNSTAVSVGDTTGSYMLDLMRSLATLGSLSSSTSGTAVNTLASDTAASLQNTIAGISTDAATLGSKQNLLTDANTQLGSLSTALSAQLANVQDVDIATTATRLTQAQTQLQASYQLIADLKNLSLVAYL